MHTQDSNRIQARKVIFIVGPTAVGKSRVALGLSRRLNIEVISCDSMQVYKGTRIISAAPDASVGKRLRQHLIGVLSPEKDYSVADFLQRSSRLIKGIYQRDKIPVFVGGSGLYMKALLEGIFKGPKANPKIRRQLSGQAEKYGKNYLYKKLNRVDPLAASKIHPSDIRRVIRALEVYKLTHMPISKLQTQSVGILQGYKVCIFGLNLRRDLLYQRIDERAEEMFKRGLLREIKTLLKRRLSKTARQIIGINELKGYLQGRYDLEEAKRLIKRNSRRYAKRQLSWFRKERRIDWISVDYKSNREIVNTVLKHISTK